MRRRHVVAGWLSLIAIGGLWLAVRPLAAVAGGDPPSANGGAAPASKTVDPVAVRSAVVRAVKRLRKEQKRDGSFGTMPGETALALLTLRDARVPADDKACRRAASNLERSLPDGSVYGAAIGIVALLEQNPRLHDSKVRELLADVISGQCKNGQWTYAYRPTKRKKAGDNSNAQFAMLALAAARAHGLKVPQEPFDRCRTFLESTQNKDGGWGYSAKERSRSYASMTAGCLMMVALARAPDAKANASRPSERRALAWLGRHFDPALNTGARAAFGAKAKKRSDSFWRHYCLWSMERAGAAAHAETFGERAWYPEGARRLLATQRDDGGWRNPETLLRATCFAVLFLGRNTRRVLTPRDVPKPVSTPSGDGAADPAGKPPSSPPSAPPPAPR